MRRIIGCSMTLVLLGLMTMFLAPGATMASPNGHYYAGYWHTNGYGVKATIYTPASQPILDGSVNPSWCNGYVTSYKQANENWVQCGWVCRRSGGTNLPCVTYFEVKDATDNYYYKAHQTTTLAWNSTRTFECVYVGAVSSEYQWNMKIAGTLVSSPVLHLPGTGNELQLMAEINDYDNQNRGKFTNGQHKSTSGGSYLSFSGTQQTESPYTWSGTAYPYSFTNLAH